MINFLVLIDFQHRSNQIKQVKSKYPESSVPQPQFPLSVCPTVPINASGITYGHGARGAFPGGFERTPAPSLF